MTDVPFSGIFKAASKLDTSIDAPPYTPGLEKCGFHTNFGKTFYGHLEANPERALKFSKAMSGWSLVTLFLLLSFNLDDTDSALNTKVVDIGGGNGNISVDLVQHYASLTFTVQDISFHQLYSAQPADVKDRVAFQQYDYTTPQPIRDAGAYIFRIAFHNNDEEAMMMLRAIIPILESRSDDPVLLIND
ncbi:O-methyltransferase [Paraphaeosphaeria sporulosa]